MRPEDTRRLTGIYGRNICDLGLADLGSVPWESVQETPVSGTFRAARAATPGIARGNLFPQQQVFKHGFGW